MAFEQQIRDLIREELQAALQPLARDVAELQRGGDLTARLRAFLGGATARSARGSTARASRKATRVAASRGRSTHACAVIGCKRPSHSKGYCSAHYQKRRNLVKTKRLPSDWAEDAKPHSVTDLVLPRGRAGAKALADAKK